MKTEGSDFQGQPGQAAGDSTSKENPNQTEGDNGLKGRQTLADRAFRRSEGAFQSNTHNSWLCLLFSKSLKTDPNHTRISFGGDFLRHSGCPRPLAGETPNSVCPTEQWLRSHLWDPVEHTFSPHTKMMLYQASQWACVGRRPG